MKSASLVARVHKRGAPPPAMSPPWADLRSQLAEMGVAFGADAVRDLEAEGCVEAAEALRGAIAGSPKGSGTRAADAAWARLKHGVGWTTAAWRECYVLGQLRSAVESGEDASGMDSGDNERRATLLHTAMLAVDMAHVMGAPRETARPFARAIELLSMKTVNEANAGEEHTADDTAAGLKISNVLPNGIAPSIDPAHALELRPNMTKKEFKKEFFNLDKPVALGCIGKEWVALDKWRDLSWLKATHGHRNIPLEMNAYDATDWSEDVKSITEFIDDYLSPSVEFDRDRTVNVSGDDVDTTISTNRQSSKPKNIAYLAQHQLFEQLPDLLSDFDTPGVCDAFGGAHRVNAWIGTSGTVTPCHFDSYDNVLGQVCGFKFVRLYHEKDAPFMYRHTAKWESNRKWPENDDGNENDDVDEKNINQTTSNARSAQGNISQVDVMDPDLSKFPLFRNAHHMDIVLGPGEFIYIPARCWHYVEALTTSVSLNFLF